jgi:hypothetical protein
MGLSLPISPLDPAKAGTQTGFPIALSPPEKSTG